MRGMKLRSFIVLEFSDDSASTHKRFLHWCFPADLQIVGLYKLMTSLFNTALEYHIHETHYTNACGRESVSCNLFMWMHVYIAMAVRPSCSRFRIDLVVVQSLMQSFLWMIWGRGLQFNWIFHHYSSPDPRQISHCLQQVGIDHFVVMRTKCNNFFRYLWINSNRCWILQEGDQVLGRDKFEKFLESSLSTWNHYHRE